MNASNVELPESFRLSDQKYPLIFVTVSGAHLYGFPSKDSDVDLRGVHVLPLDNVLSLKPSDETIDNTQFYGDTEVDLVTHDVKKFMSMMLKRNGYVLEQLLSPIVVKTSSEHEELVAIAPSCITKYHAFHYLGFAQTQWRLLCKEPKVKPLLYVFRVLLTGIHLMRTGRVEANLGILNEEFRLPFIPDLLKEKTEGKEKAPLAAERLSQFEAEYRKLLSVLEDAHNVSKLPATATAADALNDLLVRLRTAGSPAA